MPFDAARAKRLKPHRRLANQKHTARVEMIFHVSRGQRESTGNPIGRLPRRLSLPVTAADRLNGRTRFLRHLSGPSLVLIGYIAEYPDGSPANTHTHTNYAHSIACVRACVQTLDYFIKVFFSPTTPVRPATSTL